MKKIDLAFEFAAKKHERQKRKNYNVPYIAHLYEAFQIVRAYTNDEATLIGAILHDTLEDTDTTFEEIEENFGHEVAQIVGFCSEKDKKIPYLQRKMEHALRMMNAPIKAKLVKCADDLSNWKTTLLDIKNGENPWEKFHADKETVKFNYAMSVATFEELKQTYPTMYEIMIDLFNNLFDEHFQSLNFEEALQFMPRQTKSDIIEKKNVAKNLANENHENSIVMHENLDNNPNTENKEPNSVVKITARYFKLGVNIISDCRQCPYSVETLDPDPYDWFRDDDTRVDCRQLERNIVRQLEGFHESVPIPDDCPFLKENSQ